MMLAFDWPNPPTELHLAPGEIHIWRAMRMDVAPCSAALMALLNPQEHAHAAKFKLERDRMRFVFCRGALRQLLGQYTGAPATDIIFVKGRYGKPALAHEGPGADWPRIHFNISHTRGLALFAFSATLPVGIDVEEIDPAHDWETTGRQFFHPNEWASLESQPSTQRARAGYELWTCKEAYLKACGAGIGGGLDSFQVVPARAPGEEARIESGNAEIGQTFLQSLDVGSNFAAAIAALGRPTSLRTWSVI